MIDFYPAKNNDRLNRVTFAPETYGRVMVNPRYPIRELARVSPWWCARCTLWHTFPRVRCDSGAFQDIGKRRYFPWSALKEQLELERRLAFLIDDPAFHFEVVFTYDNPAGVDEAIVNGKKIKVRGTHATAARAVEDTIAAAHYYASQRSAIKGAIGFVGQGIDPEQYMECITAILPLMQAGDVFGFGGFCIWGRMPKRITGIAHATIARAVPLLKAHGIQDFHMLGVMYAPAIKWVSVLADACDVTFATDGSGPEQAGCIAGRGYLNGRQIDVGNRQADKYITYHPCQLAMENIKSYIDWTETL